MADLANDTTIAQITVMSQRKIAAVNVTLTIRTRQLPPRPRPLPLIGGRSTSPSRPADVPGAAVRCVPTSSGWREGHRQFAADLALRCESHFRPGAPNSALSDVKLARPPSPQAALLLGRVANVFAQLDSTEGEDGIVLPKQATSSARSGLHGLLRAGEGDISPSVVPDATAPSRQLEQLDATSAQRHLCGGDGSVRNAAPFSSSIRRPR